MDVLLNFFFFPSSFELPQAFQTVALYIYLVLRHPERKWNQDMQIPSFQRLYQFYLLQSSDYSWPNGSCLPGLSW